MIPAARRFDHLHGAVREAAIEQAHAIEREAMAAHAMASSLIGVLTRHHTVSLAPVRRNGMNQVHAWEELVAVALIVAPPPVASPARLNRAERRAAARRAAR